jgi:hypothetical protein
MGVAARASVLRDYNWERNLGRLDACFQRASVTDLRPAAEAGKPSVNAPKVKVAAS